RGTYSRASGQVSGTVSGNTFSGTWSQRTGTGKFVFTMSADGKSFSGTWGYNDNNDTYSDWTGTRNTVTYVTDNSSPAAPASASLSDVKWDNASKNLGFRLLFGNTASDAWVGIVPAGTAGDSASAEKAAVDSRALKGLTSGNTVSMVETGIKAGNYEVRVYNGKTGGKLLASASFTVAAEAAPAKPATASLSNVKWDNGSKKLTFKITFSNVVPDAWVGIIPAGTSDDEFLADKVDVDYKALKALRSGNTVTMTEKDIKAGKYELRVYNGDAGGKLLARASFTVAGSSSSSKSAAAALSNVKWNGETKKLSFKIKFGNVASDAWVGIVPASTASDSKSAAKAVVDSKNLKNLKSGNTVSLTEKNIKPGKYEIRVYNGKSGGKLLTKASFTVASPAAASLSGVKWDN
ncbi:MAG: hypothetical protein J6X60_11915, partial [Ruminiclostridium sp.]|nr:hypothetical protein [Ruminiclostridium sp.]